MESPLGASEIGVELAFPASKGDAVYKMFGLVPIPVMFSIPVEIVLGI
jgi:hypothetical protein